jgi:hypothetical protein
VPSALVCLVVIVGAAAPARAETVTERATRLFNEARELKQRGKPGACERFAESYALVAGAGTGFNLAECKESEGDLVRAIELFEQIAKEYERSGRLESAQQARMRAAALRDRVGELVIEIPEPVASVVLVVGGERVVAAAKLQQLVNPGDVEITATVPGRRPFMTTVTARAGRTSTVRVAFPPAVTRESRRRRSRVVLSAGLGVVGLGAMVAGGVMFSQARGLDADGRRDAAVARADLATGFGIGGLAFAAAAGIVFWTAPREVVLVPVVTVEAGGVAITGRF